jgi:hypothetical protein
MCPQQQGSNLNLRGARKKGEDRAATGFLPCCASNGERADLDQGLKRIWNHVTITCSMRVLFHNFIEKSTDCKDKVFDVPKCLASKAVRE